MAKKTTPRSARLPGSRKQMAKASRQAPRVPVANQRRRANSEQVHGAIPGGPGSSIPPDPRTLSAGQRLQTAPPASERLRARLAMLEALDNMPDDGFAWFVRWAAGDAKADIYPENLGGFSQDGAGAVNSLRLAAKRYLEAAN